VYALPEEARRTRARGLFKEYLQDNIFCLNPVSIIATETLESETSVSFSFFENKELVGLENKKGAGFIDAVFRACLERYSLRYKSLERIKLTDFRIQPVFDFRGCELQTDAKTDVILTVEICSKGPSRFSHHSDSIIFSGFTTIISIFEFYINCSLCYKRVKYLINEAESRQRADLTGKYKHDISHLVELGPYV